MLCLLFNLGSRALWFALTTNLESGPLFAGIWYNLIWNKWIIAAVPGYSTVVYKLGPSTESRAPKLFKMSASKVGTHSDEFRGLGILEFQNIGAVVKSNSGALVLVLGPRPTINGKVLM